MRAAIDNLLFLKSAISMILLCGILPISAQVASFPQAGKIKYYGAALSCPQNKLNSDVTAFYDHWKKKYLKQSTVDKSEYKVAINNRNFTVSEAMGYGMVIMVQIAGYDPNAEKYFDGMNKYRKRFPSKFKKSFMCWEVRNDKKNKPNDSATDGDCDMAAALIMASVQWEEPKYAKEALVIIDEIKKSLIRKDYSLRLGDWDSDEEEHQAVRPSDFATANFYLFYCFTGDDTWLKVSDKCYDILDELQNNFAPKTGLVPDFALYRKDGSLKPAFPDFMETKHDGDYSYNSCRVPWRIALDSILNDNKKAKRVCSRLIKWATSDIPNIKKFKGGYKLNGKAFENYDEPVFTAPIAVAAMAVDERKYAEDGYEFVKDYKVDYFSDTINLLSLMVMSHNFHMPVKDNTVTQHPRSASVPH